MTTFRRMRAPRRHAVTPRGGRGAGAAGRAAPSGAVRRDAAPRDTGLARGRASAGSVHWAWQAHHGQHRHILQGMYVTVPTVHLDEIRASIACLLSKFLSFQVS